MEKSEPTKTVKALGRGLSSLLKSAVAEAESEAQAIGLGRIRIQEIPLDKIVPGSLQSRKIFNQAALAELADSIRQVGIIQPVVVRPTGPGKYELISGERRWRASKMAGLAAIPALIREDADVGVLQVSLIENVQRAELNAVERAQAYALFRDTFNLSVEEMAKKTGEDRTTVINYLRLLELPAMILEMVQKDQLTMGHARALLSLPDASTQLEYAAITTVRALSVRQLEKVVAQFRRGQLMPQAAIKQTSPTAIHLEEQISTSLGMRVRVKLGKKKGSGTLAIKFGNLDDFDRLMGLFGVKME